MVSVSVLLDQKTTSVIDTSVIFSGKLRSVCCYGLGSLVSVVMTWKNQNINRSYFVAVMVLPRYLTWIM